MKARRSRRAAVGVRKSVLEKDEREFFRARRLTRSIEDGLRNTLERAVFEPNNSRLWGNLKSSVEGFMQNLYEQGSFAGTNPDQAYLV